MQQSREDYQRYLRVGKLAGSLTPEEEKVFEQLLREDANFAASFALLKEKLPTQKLEALEKFRDSTHWGELQARLNARVGRQVIIRNVSIAVVVAAVVFLTTMILVRQEKQPAQVARIPTGVQLTLANGETINLSDSNGIIQTEKALINNSDNRLTYSVGETPDTGTNTLMVAPGLDYTITLSDGTEVSLNSTTTLRFPLAFIGTTREITVDGEAYIKVARNTEQPFTVHLTNSTVHVTGTSFNVNTYNTNTNIVSLVEGSVIMKTDKKEIHLTPGKQGVSSPTTLYQKDFNAEKTLSWQRGLLYFDKTPLPQIADVIERWFNVKVVIDNTRNEDKLFVGVVNKHRPLEVLLKDLETAAEIESYFDKEKVLHFK